MVGIGCQLICSLYDVSSLSTYVTHRRYEILIRGKREGQNLKRVAALIESFMVVVGL